MEEGQSIFAIVHLCKGLAMRRQSDGFPLSSGDFPDGASGDTPSVLGRSPVSK